METIPRDCHAVRSFCASRNINLARIDVIGFHGQTILHAPQEGRTWQLVYDRNRKHARRVALQNA